MVNLIDAHTAERAVWWLGETKGFWVQTGALFISALGAVLIVRSRSQSERRRATVDLVLHQINNQELLLAKKEFFKIIDSPEKNCSRFLNQKDTPQYGAIVKLLNTYEFVAGGIREKAYDEKLYKRMQCSAVIRAWDSLSGFVEEFRNSMPQQPSPKTFYQDFEWLAKKWKKDRLAPFDD